MQSFLNKVLLFLYRNTPKRFQFFIGSLDVLRPLRDLILREKGKSRIIEVMVPMPIGNEKFYFNSDLRTSKKLLIKPIEGRLLRTSLGLITKNNENADNIVLDVGASFGYLSLVWSKTIALNGYVYSFEANTHVASILSKNVERNNLESKVMVIKSPVFSGKRTMYFEEGPSASRINSKGGMQVSKESISIDSFVSDNTISRIDLIKIDVDGPEYEILLGAKESIMKFKPLMIVEHNNDPKVVSFLENLGYFLFELDMAPFSFKGSNIVCLPNKI